MSTTAAPSSMLYSRLAPVRARLAANDERLLATQIALCEIASPTGDEHERGACVAARMRSFGLSGVHADEVGNVIGVRQGEDPRLPPVVVCAHLDTVFPAGTPIEVTRVGERLSAPGIVDNSRGLAAMLSLAELIDGRAVRTRHPVMFVATVGEEGSGDLRGAKHLFASMMAPAACIALDGAGDERIVTRALGSRRYRVTFTGEGGHSWAAFGIANPLHAAGMATSKLAALPLPRTPRTTLSVCRMGGGISINAIPHDAWIEIDLRSSSQDALDRTAEEIELAIRAAVREENARRSPGTSPLTCTILPIGSRPSGNTDSTHALVQAAMLATMAIGKEPDLATASTDANVPMNLGIPSIAIGAGGRGGAVHTTGEWFENTRGPLGVARALTIIASVAGLL